MRGRAPWLLAAAVAFAAIALAPWHPDDKIRRGAALVAATLVLWISEAAPLGVVGLLLPIGASAAGLLTWPQAIAVWGDPTVFLFLGAFLLARALDKHGAFDWITRLHLARSGPLKLALLVLLLSGAFSTVQNNTAVAAMLLPATVAMARQASQPALPLLALSLGSTFGGMATPVGTAPNFIGYAAMQKLDAGTTFISWLWVGVPVWLGASVIAWGVLAIAATLGGKRSVAACSEKSSAAVLGANRTAAAADNDAPTHAEQTTATPRMTDLGPLRPEHSADGSSLTGNGRDNHIARRVAVAALVAAACIWLTGGAIKGADVTGSGLGPLDSNTIKAAAAWFDRYLPDSLVPVLAAGFLFLIPAGRGRGAILDRHDFQLLDWDTLFLIAGGLCLGRALEASGAAKALAEAVAAAQLSPFVLMLALGGVTVLLSELTSNTATASLMVPIAGALGHAAGISATEAIWLVALSASLGFALPVSTPPNAIVYGTRLVPLRLMIACGIAIDILCLIWTVTCLRVLA